MANDTQAAPRAPGAGDSGIHPGYPQPMSAVVGRFLQIVGLVVSGTGCVLAFRAETSEAAFIGWGAAGFAVFFVGSRLRGVRPL